MRFMFSLTGLVVLLLAVYLAGSTGLGALTHAGSAMSDAVGRIIGSESAPTSGWQKPAELPTETKASAATRQVATAGTVNAEASLSRPTPTGENAASRRTSATPATPRAGVPDIAELGRRPARPPTAVSPPEDGQRAAVRPDQTGEELKSSLRDLDYLKLPDGVSRVRFSPDGGFESVIAKGTSVVPATLGVRGQRIALDRAGLRARAALTRWLVEHIECKLTDNNHVEFQVTGDAGGSKEAATERFDTRDTIVLTSEAILRGTVSLYQDLVNEQQAQEAVVVVGISQNTLRAALELQGRFEAPPVPIGDSPAGTQRQGVSQRIWAVNREQLDEMGF